MWKRLSDLGLPESFGGADETGIGFRELSLLAFECGNSLLPENLIESAFFGAYFLSRVLSKSERESVLQLIGENKATELLAGSRVPQVALVSAGSGSPGAYISIEAGHCSCALPLVVGSKESDVLIVLERTSASRARIIIVKTDSEAHASCESVPLLDPTMSGCKVELKKAPCVLIEGVSAERALQLFHTLHAVEMAGACARAIEMTVEFVKTREQFGVPVGGFQAVQHRLADMYLQSEALGAIARFASWAADHAPEQLPLASASALSQAVEQASAIVEGAIQLHGGIGFTYEYDLHFYLRRTKCVEALLRFNEGELGSLVVLAA
jgi:acyl-CoA dehydrogenase